MIRKNDFYLSVYFVSIVLLFQSCAVNPVTGKKDLVLMSEQQEIAMGAQNDPGIVAYFGLYDDPKLQDFINVKGEEMVGISHRSNLDFKFRILDSPVVNAFAVPGGYVYFTRGIMAHFNNEAEFAGVLGHEIGHVTARHSVRQQSQQMLLTGAFVVGMMASKEFRNFSDVAAQSLGLLFLKFSREHETESDILGVEYSTAVGYDAHYMANFFNTLDRMHQESGAETIPDFLSTHPNPADRHKYVNALATKYQQNLQVDQLKVNRNQYLKMIDGLVFGEDPRQGYVADNNFYHPGLLFQFPIPQKWQLLNSQQQVQMAPEEGKAAMILTLAPEESLQEAAESINNIDSVNVIDSKSIRLNGLNAMVMLCDKGTQLRFNATLIQYREHIYRFYAISTQEDYNDYAEIMANTSNNFKILDNPAKINVKPQRIHVKEAGANTSLKNVFISLNVDPSTFDQLAILNSMDLTDQVKRGDLIKIIQ